MSQRKIKSYESEKELLELLLKVGLSQREAEIYVCLCSIGPQPGSVVARSLNMKRTTVYHSLQRMAEKGFVFGQREMTVTYFHLNPIKEAIAKVDRMKKELDLKKAYLTKLSGTLKKTQITIKVPSLKFRDCTGPANIKKLKMSTLSNSGELLIFSSHNAENYLNITDHKFWYNFKKMVQQKNVTVRIIIPQSEEHSKVVDLLKHPRITIKSVPQSLFPISEKMEVNILPEKVIFLGDSFGAEIDNKELATLQKTAFDLAWMGAEAMEKTAAVKPFFI